MAKSLVIIVPWVALAVACAPAEGLEPYADHEEPSDFEEVAGDGKDDSLSPTFVRANVMSDEFFTDTGYIDADGLQIFFEETPYGRSWLADAMIGELRAADAIVAASLEHGLNPIVMVARMQVEKSLVSKTVRPAQARIDFAFGCGCPDGRACNEAYRGLDKQVACAASTLRKWYDRSIEGTGIWNKGVARKTLDPAWITPVNHATASLYAYTPWVLTGSGGNWLVWNVTRRFARHAEGLGVTM